MKESVEDRINALYKKHGTITPDIVIEDAKNPKSPLHGSFEWDLEKAAMEAWRETARRIIRSVTIVITTESHRVAVPRYVRTPDAVANVQSYSDTAVLKTDHERAIDAMMGEIERLETIVDRVRKISMALDLENEVNIISKNIASIRRKIA
jgi:hypothetical protein